MKEVDRLAAVVARIDEDTAVVPRGAYIRTPLGEVVLNKSFQGECQGSGFSLQMTPAGVSVMRGCLILMWGCLILMQGCPKPMPSG